MRGPLLMCWQLTLSVSQIIAAGINRGMINIDTTFAYRFPIAFQFIFPLLILSGLWFVPESPRWLLRKARPDAEAQAERSLRSLHRDNSEYDPRPTLVEFRAAIDREAEAEVEGGWMQLVTDPIERRKVIYSAGALIAQQSRCSFLPSLSLILLANHIPNPKTVNGIQWFYYFGTVFSKAIGLEDPFMMTVIVFIIQVFVVLAAVLLANKLPRRPLLMITTGIMTVSIFVVGCLGIPGGEPSAAIGKVIISFVIIEIVAFNFAWGPLGWTIVSPILSTSIILLPLYPRRHGLTYRLSGIRNGCRP